MSQFGQWDAHIEPSTVKVYAVWEVSINITTTEASHPATDDLIEWGVSGFTAGTGKGTGVVISWDSSANKLRFYRTNHLAPVSESEQTGAFPIAGHVLRRYVAGPSFPGGGFVSTVTAVETKNSRGFHINPPWFVGTPPTTRTQTAIAVDDGLFVDAVGGRNRYSAVNANLGVDTFDIDIAWGAVEIVDAPAVVYYRSGYTPRLGLVIPSTGDRLVAEALARDLQILDRSGWRFEGGMIGLGSNYAFTTGNKIQLNTSVYEALPIKGTAGSIVDTTNFRVKTLPHWTKCAVWAQFNCDEHGTANNYIHFGFEIRKTGSTNYQGQLIGGASENSDGTYAALGGVTTIAVTGGTDYFEMWGYSTRATPSALANRTWLGIMAIQFDLQQ